MDELIEKKANGNAFQESNIKMKLLFKGIIPENINDNTPDDEELISKIFEVADNFNITLTK